MNHRGDSYTSLSVEKFFAVEPEIHTNLNTVEGMRTQSLKGGSIVILGFTGT
jgi:hypothetical protein